MRHHNDGVLAFEPRLPEGIVRLAFNPFLRGQRLRVEIAHDSARYSVTDGVPLIIKHHRQPARVTAGEPLELPIPPTVVRPAPTQQSGRAPAHRRGTGHNS